MQWTLCDTWMLCTPSYWVGVWCLLVFQVVSEGNGLLEILQTPVASSAYNSIISQADYRVGASHLINMIHETLEKNKTIEDCWVATKAQLNQKLGLRLFQKDVLQVCSLFVYFLVCNFSYIKSLVLWVL